jgi:hypothetical protein
MTNRNPHLKITRLTGMLLFIIAANALSAEPAFVELNKPKENAPWIGEMISFSVDIAVEGRFSGSTHFDLPKVSNVILMKPEERPVVSSRTVDGREYSVQRHEFAIFCQRSEETKLPSFSVRCGAIHAPGESVREYTLRVPGFSVSPRLPDGTKQGQLVVSTRNLNVHETWSPPPDGEAKVGDTFRRTVTMKAEDLPGMLLPPIPQNDIRGIGVYPESPSITDKTERGAFTGERGETIIYVCEQSGIAKIPAVQVRWWDPSGARWKEITLPAVSLRISRDDSPLSTNVLTRKKPPLWLWISGGITILATLLLLFARKHKPTAEEKLFNELLLTCRQNRATDAYNAFTRWRDDPDMPKGLFPSEILNAINLAQRTIIGLDETWDGSTLTSKLISWRKRQRKNSIPDNALPPLNPQH